MTTDITLDQAQHWLTTAGYTVTVDTDSSSIVADISRGRHHAMAAITAGHDHQLVSQWWSATPEAERTMSSQYGPDSVRAAVECALAVVGTITKAHAADQLAESEQPETEEAAEVDETEQPAAEVDQAPDVEDAGIDFPGLEEACYGVPEVEPAPADAAPTKCSACTDGHTYSGDCRYEVVAVAEIEVDQDPDAEPAQDGAEPDSAVSA